MVTDPDILITKPPRNLEEFMVFAVCVAGKTARVMRRLLDKFWDQALHDLHFQSPYAAHEWWKRGPFEILRQFEVEEIAQRLRDAGIGCHSMKARALYRLAWWKGLDLAKASTEQLEIVPGIGPKTSRYFILYTRPDERVAVLDTHILAWMREQGVDVPKTTPSGRRYLELEKKFLSLVPEGKSVAEFDLEIWKERRK